MTKTDFVVRGKQILALNKLAPFSIHVKDGKVIRVSNYEDVSGNTIEISDESILMPGLVDTHVHINEPGRTEWEGFETATRAAAAGGVTTLIDMPLNSIPATTTLGALKEKREAAKGKCFVDVGFWGGVVPKNTDQIEPLWNAGVVGFKCFLIHSGVDDFPNVTEGDLREALPELSRLNSLLIVHAEVPRPVEEATREQLKNDPRRYDTFLKTRPRKAEDEAIDLIVRLCRETKMRMHIVHHSSADSLPLLKQARDEGLPITIETCPHYLCFVAEEIPDGATEFKCCPPIRESNNREKLWKALQDGLIEMIVSDHSPCTPDLKLRDKGDFLKAWGGISSLQLRLPLVWTEGSKRGFSIEKVSNWLSSAPARLAALEKRKGKIDVGYDADFVVWNPEKSFVVEPSMLHHRHKLTPYQGKILNGVVEQTYLRGELIYDKGNVQTIARGELITLPIADCRLPI
jgi:allantoinase